MTAIDSETVVIDTPGVFSLTDDQYFADPVPGGSLSSSGARLLLAPSCPAKYRAAMDEPFAATKDMNLGKAAHGVVLGTGPDLVVVDAADWRTKAAQTARDEALARDAVPLLPAQMKVIQEMAAALRAHPLASILFDREHGTPEQALFWRDTPTGIMRRCKLDWLPDEAKGRHTIFAEYKTCRSAAPKAIGRALADYGYHQQASWNLDGIRALQLAASPVFWFVAQEKVRPYVVTVAEVDVTGLRIGHERNREAIDIYARCTETGHWPAYSESPVVVSLPQWAEMDHIATSAPNGEDW